MMSKVLILYASKKGSTAEVAAYLADVLRKEGISVDVTNASEFNKDVRDYTAVVIGTGIYNGMWLQAIWTTVRHLAEQLKTIPVWGFALCVRVLEDSSKLHIQQHYLPLQLTKQINLQDFRFFAGRILDLSPTESATFAQRYDGEYLHRRGDYRDWNAIHAYGLEIAKALTAVTA